MKAPHLMAIAMAAIAGLTGSLGQASAQTSINTYSGWDGSTNTISFGLPNTQVYGETFTAPEQYLNDWSFWLADGDGGEGVTLTANVGTWTGNSVGSVLWTSTPVSGTGSSTFVQYFFDTGNLPLLTGGQQYVFYLNATGGTGDMALGALPTDVYADGNFVYDNNYGTLDVTQPWDGLSWPNPDAVFVADFSNGLNTPVPEPGALSLLTVGLVGLTGSRWRRKRSTI